MVADKAAETARLADALGGTAAPSALWATPDDLAIRVEDQTCQWEEGKVLIFDDAFEHELTYNSSLPRTVLLVDVSLLLIVAPVADVLPQPDLTRSSTSF